MLKLAIVLADVDLPGTLTENSARQAAIHWSPTYVIVAIIALVVVGFLIWDLFRQKRSERRERRRLERFRENLPKTRPAATIFNEPQDNTQR